MPETTEPTAREMALEAAKLWKKVEDDLDAVGVQAAALVAIALHLTEPAPVDDATLDHVAKVIWDTSRADEGTISATGAKIVARAVLAALPTTELVSEPCRQSTGLARIADAAATLDLPPEVSVTADRWDVDMECDDHHKPIGYVAKRGEREFHATPLRGDRTTFPTLADAVAAILRGADS